MQKHTKIYMDYFGYDTSDFIPCEVCGMGAVDIHHIDARGMGGDPKGKKDVIENLQAVCRDCHTKYGDIAELKEVLKKVHLKFMEIYGKVKNTFDAD
jgi:5-methylcytosine-specific restriction endonuclease McrA